MNGVNFLLAFIPDPEGLFSTLRNNVLWDERIHARKTASFGDSSEKVDFQLPAGSLIYMTQDVQEEWLHAIPASETDNGRMSLTFRAIKQITNQITRL
ncbi:hypothetical protein [Chitinophaga sp. S165]|uniref:hypothetical protein n=1 Tax=Chitinophaga sp. S165 TaxID=2135462 RepID=UPI000D714EAA|nr:hypothetical protein [Chitinophaga sp. S165]PWV56777.1 hypothetical protein C7475_1011294 [Chitinophaga sp. S165]